MSVGVKGGVPFILPLTPTGSCATQFESFQKSYNNLTPSSVAMSIATTFGTASTGTAISSLSGIAAQKAALAWLGRMTKGIATKGIVTGAGMAAGQAFMALAGPIGWGLSAASTTASLISLSSKNKEIAQEAIAEAKQLLEIRESVLEVTARITQLRAKTDALVRELSVQIAKAYHYLNQDYLSLDEETQVFLGTLVNNTQSLAALLNKNIE